MALVRNQADGGRRTLRVRHEVLRRLNVEEIGERTVLGGGDEYIFSVPEQATTPAVADGISSVKMVKVGDSWLVAAHRFLGEGEGSA